MNDYHSVTVELERLEWLGFEVSQDDRQKVMSLMRNR